MASHLTKYVYEESLFWWPNHYCKFSKVQSDHSDGEIERRNINLGKNSKKDNRTLYFEPNLVMCLLGVENYCVGFTHKSKSSSSTSLSPSLLSVLLLSLPS
jgi:hypothetical protein